MAVSPPRVRLDNPADPQQRRRVERELRRRGLPSLATHATLRDSAAFAIPSLRVLKLYLGISVLLLASWTLPNMAGYDIYPQKDFLFLIDIFSGLTGAAAAFVAPYIARRDGPRRGIVVAVLGAVMLLIPAVAVPAFMTPISPHALTKEAEHDPLATVLHSLTTLGPVDLATTIQNWLLGVGIALFLTLGVLSGAFASAIQVGRTVFFQLLASFRDVISAVPALVVALFFFLLLSDVWYAVGQLSSPRLIAVLVLLGLVTTSFIVDITRVEVRMLMEGQGKASQGNESEGKDAIQWLEAPYHSKVTPQWSNGLRTRAELWVQMGVPTLLRVLLAGAFLACLLGFAGALLTSPAMLTDWLHHKPHVILEGSPLGVQLFFTREGLSVSALLGAFAGLAYAATALEAGANRTRLLGKVRRELADGLALGAYYRGALAHDWWKPTKGTRWPSPRPFMLEERRRREERALELGMWIDDQEAPIKIGGKSWPAFWSACWFPGSEELIVIRMIPYPTEVRLLGYFRDEQAVKQAVEPISTEAVPLPFSLLLERV